MLRSQRLLVGRRVGSSLTRLQQTRDASTIKKLMAANRGEIATRIMRAGNELGLRTVGIFSKEDRFTQHRYKADESFLVGAGKSPSAPTWTSTASSRSPRRTTSTPSTRATAS